MRAVGSPQKTSMRLLAAASALTVALLDGASVALGANVGANDDSAKHSEDGGVAIYGDMARLGLRQTVIGVRFVPSDAMVIQDKQLLDRILSNAQAPDCASSWPSTRTRRRRSKPASPRPRSSRRTSACSRPCIHRWTSS